MIWSGRGGGRGRGVGVVVQEKWGYGHLQAGTRSSTERCVRISKSSIDACEGGLASYQSDIHPSHQRCQTPEEEENRE